MAFPDASTVRSFANPEVLSFLASSLPDEYVADQTFTVDLGDDVTGFHDDRDTVWYEVSPDGTTGNVVGTSGPFGLVVDSETILCSALSLSTGVVTVWSDDDGNNGRGYDYSSIVAHSPGNLANLNVRPTPTVTALAQIQLATVSDSFEVTYNGQTFTIPASSVPEDWDGTGNISALVQLTTGDTLVSGLLDASGDAIPDGWTFPAVVFFEGTTIYDIIALNSYTFGGGAGISWWGSDGGQPTGVINGSTLILPAIPTSDPGVAGQLYSNAGIVTVSAG